MKCPECDGTINDTQPHCESCGFDIADFDELLKVPAERSGAVNDWAGALSDTGYERLTGKLEEFTAATGIDFCLVTLLSSEPRSPREFSFWLFNRWKIGGDGHLGALVLLSMTERRIEVEVGYGIEKYIDDDEAAGVLQHHAVPFLKKGDFDNGLFYSLDMLAKIFEHGLAEEKINGQSS
ncbi:MAG TPA: TPM domain-containing protein [Candidatus Rifleibacterium sp.]|nr:TPM domain-containing protein [Candidatus Rifleibacterium sp.]HPT46995.1 TPM domain-containing protein [Candidatus Rifleibacterium sp.]